MNPFDHEVTFSFGISRSKLVDGALDDIFGKDNGEIIDRIDMSNGFEAIAVKNKVTNEVVIAFRGSDFEDKGIDWWGQNLSIWQQFNALGVYDKRVVNYVNQDDVVGNYGVHFGKVVVTDDGEPPVERNDYLYPNKDKVRTVIARAVKLLREGGTEKFRFEHSLDPFDAHFGREGNIAR